MIEDHQERIRGIFAEYGVYLADARTCVQARIWESEFSDSLIDIYRVQKQKSVESDLRSLFALQRHRLSSLFKECRETQVI